MVVAAKQFIIPYGVCKTTSDGTLNKIDEKPRQEALINTGLYLINPKIVNLIPKNKAIPAKTQMTPKKNSFLNVSLQHYTNSHHLKRKYLPQFLCLRNKMKKTKSR